MSNTPSKAEIEALVKRHGATSYRNRADTQHPAYGFTEDGLNGLIGEVLAKWGTPQQEVQEPYAYAVYFPDQPKVELVHDLDELIDDLTNQTHVVTKLYTAPQPAPAPLSEMPYEKQKAIQEGEQIGASDAWFHARHNMLDTLDRRNVFRAGFDRGWNAAIAAQGGK